MNKLKTKITHSFNIEDDSMEDIDFTFNLPIKNIKKKTSIIEVKKKQKIRNDVSTRLF